LTDTNFEHYTIITKRDVTYKNRTSVVIILVLVAEVVKNSNLKLCPC